MSRGGGIYLWMGHDPSLLRVVFSAMTFVMEKGGHFCPPQVLDVCDRVSRDGGEDGALARDARLVAGMAIDAAREASEASAGGKASLDETLWIVEEVRALGLLF